MSLAQTLCQGTLDSIVTHFDLEEMGAPYKMLTSPAMPAPVGSVRLFSGGPINRLVYIGLTVPFIQLDSHMLFAFTAPDSPLPHFTLDSVLAGEHFAFHLDLIPRADLGANLAYIDEALHPLSEAHEAAKQIEGLSPAHLSPRQYALMSPWMLAYRANEAAFAQIDGAVATYRDHWLKLVDNGLSAATTASLAGVDFATRDQRNRDAIFSPEVDPVWAQVERLVGADTAVELRELLRLPAA